MLYTLNATRVLSGNQHKLRKVLRYQITSLSLDQSLEHSLSNEDDSNQQPTLLIQKLLMKATQPSPLKSVFTIQDMQLGALNLSQYLAAEENLNLDKPASVISISNDKILLGGAVRGVPEANLSEAPTPSECSIKSVLSEKSSKRRKNDESSNFPVNPIVGQIVEMGFTKKSVENAMKSLGLATETLLTPEIIVSWLLEHPEVAASDTESLSSYYSSESEEASEQIDVALHSLGELGTLETSVANVITYSQRSDFLSNDEYAMYVRDNVSVGMLVRCCKSYEEVHVGDIGKVIKIDREGLHDLNLQVNWQNRVNTYWVRFIHVELLGFPPALPSTPPIKVGDRVRVKPTVATPRYKWGYVTHECVGVVTAVAPNGHDVTVDFPKQDNWTGLVAEMEVVPSSHEGTACGGCSATPIRGARYRCRVCDGFDYCENCFFTKKGHRHAFGRLAEAGIVDICF